MPLREYHSSCVCVPPGGPPEGILDIAEYIVCRVVFFLFVLVFCPQHHFFGKVENFSAKRPMSQKFFFKNSPLELPKIKITHKVTTKVPTAR